MTYKHIIIILLSFGLFSACSQEDLDPTLDQVKNIETSINTVGDLEDVLVGAYNRMSDFTLYGRNSIILGEVFSDNCTSNANSNRFVDEARMDLLATNEIADNLWETAYQTITQTNIVIGAKELEGEQESIDNIKGQAYALRALIHFNLVKYYGQQHVNGGDLSSLGVPYVTTFKDLDNLAPARNTVKEVRDMAYADLETARGLMSEELNSTNEYITTYAVDAIEARIALYFGDWDKALTAANSVINSGAFSIASSTDFLANFALDNTPNSIFEMSYNGIDKPDINGLYYIYQGPSYGDVIALPNLVAIYGTNDVRGLGGVISDVGGTFRNTGKYPSASMDDNVSIIRYAEIILIKAEALFEKGSPDAITWLNKIPANREAALYTSATKENILLERRKELAFEGFRFHTLARTHQDIPAPDSVLQTHGGPDYGSYNYALPIPSAEVNANGNMVQNAGY